MVTDMLVACHRASECPALLLDLVRRTADSVLLRSCQDMPGLDVDEMVSLLAHLMVRGRGCSLLIPGSRLTVG